MLPFNKKEHNDPSDHKSRPPGKDMPSAAPTAWEAGEGLRRLEEVVRGQSLSSASEAHATLTT